MNNTAVIIGAVGQILAVILANGPGWIEAIKKAFALSPDTGENITVLTGDAITADEELMAKVQAWMLAHPDVPTVQP